MFKTVEVGIIFLIPTEKTATFSKSATGTLLGIGMDFIVVKNGSWYYTYDEKGKKIVTMS